MFKKVFAEQQNFAIS